MGTLVTAILVILGVVAVVVPLAIGEEYLKEKTGKGIGEWIAAILGTVLLTIVGLGISYFLISNGMADDVVLFVVAGIVIGAATLGILYAILFVA